MKKEILDNKLKDASYTAFAEANRWRAVASKINDENGLFREKIVILAYASELYFKSILKRVRARVKFSILENPIDSYIKAKIIDRLIQLGFINYNDLIKTRNFHFQDGFIKRKNININLTDLYRDKGDYSSYLFSYFYDKIDKIFSEDERKNGNDFFDGNNSFDGNEDCFVGKLISDIFGKNSDEYNYDYVLALGGFDSSKDYYRDRLEQLYLSFYKINYLSPDERNDDYDEYKWINDLVKYLIIELEKYYRQILLDFSFDGFSLEQLYYNLPNDLKGKDPLLIRNILSGLCMYSNDEIDNFLRYNTNNEIKKSDMNNESLANDIISFVKKNDNESRFSLWLNRKSDTDLDKYYENYINDINSLISILSLLGNNIDFRKRLDQKIKFAYLSNKYLSMSVETIYNLYNNIDKINSKNLNLFFENEFDSFIYDHDEGCGYVNRLNINWLEKYDRNEYFDIRDGIPTMEIRFGKNAELLTLDIEEKIVNVLISENIPLVNVIVKTAFKEYFNGNLVEYIEKLKNYGAEFEMFKNQNNEMKR